MGSSFFEKHLRKAEAEGGCGVLGVACEEKVAGRHLISALCQMCNRGNGKGGGIAAAGLEPERFGVDAKILENDYLLAIAYLDLSCKEKLEKEHILPLFDIDHAVHLSHVENFQSIKGIEVKPPDVFVYFVRVKSAAVSAFKPENGAHFLSLNSIEDEIVYQNSYRLNLAFYSATGEKQAFVLSHGKNLLVLKLVGYGDDAIRYYKLEDFKAHVWIGHHRYPTKGRVWHPGGAHPFIGLNEALVHNGDFANYFSICQYLAERNIYPHFLTDTEVAALLFDLLYRVYGYPLEYVIEALAPTTERDFTLLPEKKQAVYEILQKTHMHGSPDGPWFFLIAQALRGKTFRLIGITDTSMLRPQVFALQKGSRAIGFAASEKQAIDACLRSLSEEDGRFWEVADYYWSARGGSYTDGGAFCFTVNSEEGEEAKLACANKFGEPIQDQSLNPPGKSYTNASLVELPDMPEGDLVNWIKENIPKWDYSEVNGFIAALNKDADTDFNLVRVLDIYTRLIDQHYHLGKMRRSFLIALFNENISKLLAAFTAKSGSSFAAINLSTPHALQAPTLVIDASSFLSEGERSLAREIVSKYSEGFKKFILFNCRGQRFIANGLGPLTQGVRIDVYGSSGDYLASGIDGAEIYVHGDGQDQLAQIMKEGKLVVYGDVGQAFMYGGKGGKAFILGDTAGRPMIYAVGSPMVVINGTCLDYLGESFMAGHPFKGGGFVIMNGIAFGKDGELKELETPYPGSNLFSLASGGALYIRDPLCKVSKDQLNGGEFSDMTLNDWNLILPLLEENEALFNIPVSRLLSHEGKLLDFKKIYRKIHPAHVRVLQEEEAWVKGYD